MSVILFLALAQAASAAPQNPGQPVLSEDAVRDLRANNIFSPIQPKRAPAPKVEAKAAPPPVAKPRPKPPVVTGVIYEAEKGIYRALAEDRNSSSLRLFEKPTYVAAGDEFQGYTIEYVTVDRLGVRHGETTWALCVGDSFPDIGAEAPEGAVTASAPASETPPDTSAGKSPSGGSSMDSDRRKSVLEALRERLKKKRSGGE
jgi:hypothetical protein